MTENEIKAALEVCSKATPGPWMKSIPIERKGCHVADKRGAYFLMHIGTDITATPKMHANCDFVAAARTGYPVALRELLRLRGAILSAMNGMDSVIPAWDILNEALSGEAE